jgi:chemotaxis signal transduction protein
VFDLRARLALPAPAPGAAARVAILRDALAHPVGALVDRACDVLRVPAAALRPAGRGSEPAVSGLLPMGESFVSLLDPERLFEGWRAALRN